MKTVYHGTENRTTKFGKVHNFAWLKLPNVSKMILLIVKKQIGILYEMSHWLENPMLGRRKPVCTGLF